MKPRISLAIFGAMLAGCATVTEPPPAPEPDPAAMVEPVEPPPPVVKVVPVPRPPTVMQPPPVAKPSEVDVLLTDFERLRRLSAAELAREQEAARVAFVQSRSDAARVRLAMTLAVPGHAGSEDVKALELLDPLVRNPGAGLHGLAFLLAAYIQEQRRLAGQLHGLQQNVQGLQQNVQALQQKLDALRSLERTLTEREPPRRR